MFAARRVAHQYVSSDRESYRGPQFLLGLAPESRCRSKFDRVETELISRVNHFLQVHSIRHNARVYPGLRLAIEPVQT